MTGIDLELNRDNVATDVFRSDYDAFYQLQPTVCFSNSGCGIPSDCEVDKENHLSIEIPDGIYHVCLERFYLLNGQMYTIVCHGMHVNSVPTLIECVNEALQFLNANGFGMNPEARFGFILQITDTICSSIAVGKDVITMYGNGIIQNVYMQRTVLEEIKIEAVVSKDGISYSGNQNSNSKSK